MNTQDNFEKELKDTLQEAAAIILSKGFKESVNRAVSQCCPERKEKIAVILAVVHQPVFRSPQSC